MLKADVAMIARVGFAAAACPQAFLLYEFPDAYILVHVL